MIIITHLIIKPPPLANGHGRYITHNCYTRTGACFRWGISVTPNRYKFVTTAFLERLRNGRFAPETAVRRFQNKNGHLDPEVL
jgi:hypothetical protein